MVVECGKTWVNQARARTGRARAGWLWEGGAWPAAVVGWCDAARGNTSCGVVDAVICGALFFFSLFFCGLSNFRDESSRMLTLSRR